MGGTRVGAEGADGMDGGGDLSALAPPFEPQAPAQPPPSSPGFFQRLVTPSPWEGRMVDSLFGDREGDLGAMAPQPQRPITPPTPAPSAGDWGASIGATPEEVERHWRTLEPKSRGYSLPAPDRTLEKPSIKGPMLAGNAQANPPSRGPRTAMALHVARAMGREVPGTPDSPEELAFAKAAHQALLKMTKGMTVARFLQSHQSPKTRETFGRLLDAELAKGKQPAPQDAKTPRVNPPEPVSMTTRPPLQPGG